MIGHDWIYLRRWCGCKWSVPTSLDITASLDHSCMHNANNVHPTNKRIKKNNKQKRKNNHQAYLGFLDLDDLTG